MLPLPRHILFAAFAVLLFGVGVSRAATPIRVDIKRVTIEHGANWDATIIRVTAVTESGAEVIYGGQGSYFLNVLESCQPCSMPTSFVTDSFQPGNLNFGQDTHGSFELLAGQSDPVTVPATILRKPSVFFRTGAASFKAKFTYSDLHGLIAYDDDVDLVGTYSIEFAHQPFWNGHRISFHRFFFDLQQPAN
jgi:hypothetical protein